MHHFTMSAATGQYLRVGWTHLHGVDSCLRRSLSSHQRVAGLLKLLREHTENCITDKYYLCVYIYTRIHLYRQIYIYTHLFIYCLYIIYIYIYWFIFDSSLEDPHASLLRTHWIAWYQILCCEIWYVCIKISSRCSGDGHEKTFKFHGVSRNIMECILCNSCEIPKALLCHVATGHYWVTTVRCQSICLWWDRFAPGTAGGRWSEPKKGAPHWLRLTSLMSWLEPINRKDSNRFNASSSTVCHKEWKLLF